MKTSMTLVCSAVVLTLLQAPLTASAQAASTPSTADSQPSLTADQKPIGWIEFDDATVTPVLDDFSIHLAAARTALAQKDHAQAAKALRAASQELAAQAARVDELDRQRAAADLERAYETKVRLMALTKKLDTAADQVEAGKLSTTTALDQTLDQAARADLERRWLVTDVTTWYSVTDKPQQHFLAAMDAFVQKNYQKAADEVRKAEAYVRLNAARASGQAKAGLNAANVELEKTAQALDQGTLQSEQDLAKVFAQTNHALALAHRTQAAESWAQKAYEKAGYELKAAAHGLESAATWVGTEAKSAASTTVKAVHTLGDKLVSGGVWAKEEVAESFESLSQELAKLGLTTTSAKAK